MTGWASGHFAWPLLEHPRLDIKLEEIPAKGRSNPHHHKQSFQFFFVLEGWARIRLDTSEYRLQKHEGIGIRPGTKHSISNPGVKKLQFLLVSSPPVQHDDIYTEDEGRGK